MVIGALRYISPEQVKGVEVDERCDIYSLGVVMYEMLAGKLPFESKSQFELMLAHVNTPPRHVSDVNPEVPREAGDAVMKALVKEPDQRFRNAREFRAELERIAQPVQETTPVAEPAMVEIPAVSAHEAPVLPDVAAVEAPEADGAAVKALEEEPDWRFQEARDFRAELDHTAQPVQEATLLTEPAAAEIPVVSAHEVAAWPEAAVEEKLPQPAPIAAVVERPAPGLPQPLASETELPISFLAHLLNSKLGLSLAACVLTVIMGSVMLLALLIAKP